MNKQIVIIPRPAKLRLMNYFDDNKIEYEFISMKDIPDGMPGGCVFRSKKWIGPSEAFGIKSEYSKEEIYDLIYELDPQAKKYREEDGN